MTKVAVAMSGGIDSSVAALILKQQGYEVIGISAQTTCDESSVQVIKNAQLVANNLEIPFFSLDTSKIFENKVINYFKNSYIMGQTPNPCAMCNKYVKWGVLFDFAIEKLGADLIATGHYANIKNDNGIYKLYPATDRLKDQLYFLFLLNQKHLSHTLFPLFEYTKDKVRQIAVNYDLPSKSSKESQDICFIKNTTTKKYLNNFFGSKKGNFIDISTGKVLGEHNGFWQYTIGQRKGIGIAASEPLYVAKIDAQTNTVFIGNKNSLFSSELDINNFHWSYPIQQKQFDALVKIRYNMQAIPAHINIYDTRVNIKFYTPVSAIAKGQACVLYDDNDGHLIGGGFI